jgi:ParB-like chromosome segregation protein Spo0J
MMTPGAPPALIKVPRKAVVAEPWAWPRTQLDAERVAEFIALYEDQGLAALPALDVVSDHDQWILADGWHRLTALGQLGFAEVPVNVIAAGDDDPYRAAYRHGLVTAATAARPLSRRERSAAVRRLLADSPDSSDREIARLTGVSPTTVGSHRRQLAGENEQPSEGQRSEHYLATATADELAKKLVASLDKLYTARGLGDALLGDRTGRRLARALKARHGEHAADWARRLVQWATACLNELEPPARR